MAGVRKEIQDELDLLLGRIALEQGLISPDQLKDAAAEQARDLAGGRKQARPLGVILVSKGYLSDVQLTSLLEEQKAKAIDPETARRQDLLLGRLLIRRGQVSAERVNECLRIQAEAMEGRGELALEGSPPGGTRDGSEGRAHPGDHEGRPSIGDAGPASGRLPLDSARGEKPAPTAIPRLGELLVSRGYATAEAVGQALAQQQKTILACGECGKRYNARDYDPAVMYSCNNCGAVLEPLPVVDSVRVDESVGELPPVKDE